MRLFDAMYGFIFLWNHQRVPEWPVTPHIPLPFSKHI